MVPGYLVTEGYFIKTVKMTQLLFETNQQQKEKLHELQDVKVVSAKAGVDWKTLAVSSPTEEASVACSSSTSMLFIQARAPI